MAFQPWSQALQDYTEMATLYAGLHRKLAPTGGTVQMLARIGYGPTVAPRPRWPLGVTLPQFTVLNHLVRVKDGRTPLELARAFQVP